MADARTYFATRLERTAEAVRRQLAGVGDEEARWPLPPALAPVAWQVAHVAVTDGAVLARMGRPDPRPEGWAERFTGDLKGGYPPLAEALAAFDRIHALLLDAARDVALETPIEGSRSYATFGDALTFVGYHRGYHTGKLATLRALLGKPRLT